MNMIMCGNDVFANVYMRLYWVRALNTRTSILIRKKRFGQSQICRTKTTILRQKQTWSDVSEKQGTRITSYQKLSLVQFSCSVVSDSLQPHESQHARPPCPSPTPGVYSNSCPSSWWCHPAISSSVVPFSSCPQLLPVSGPFPMNQLFSWGGQSIGVSASASVLPVNTQDLFLQDALVGSPWSPRDSQESSPTPQFKSINFLALSFLHSPTLTRS